MFKASIALMLILCTYISSQVGYCEHYVDGCLREKKEERRFFRQVCRTAECGGRVVLFGSLFAQSVAEINYRHHFFWRPRRRYSSRPYVFFWSLGAAVMALANLLEVCSDYRGSN